MYLLLRLADMVKAKNLKDQGEYRNLRRAGNVWKFQVKIKGGWQEITGLSAEVSQTDAEQFATNTAYSWRKK